MSKQGSGTEKRTVTTDSGGFEVFAEPAADITLKVSSIETLSDGPDTVAVSVRSEHLNGRFLMLPDEAAELADALTEAAGEAAETGELEDLPEWVVDGTDRQDAVAAVAWDHAHQAKVALTGESRDPEAAKAELRAALSILDEIEQEV